MLKLRFWLKMISYPYWSISFQCYRFNLEDLNHFQAEWFNPTQMVGGGRGGEGGSKKAPYQFFPCIPVTSTNVGISLQNFLTFSFNSCHTLLSQLLNLSQSHPSKKQFFWSNPYKTEVLITFLIEMQNFGRMTTSSRDKILLVTSWTEIITSWHLFQNTFILRRLGVAIFDDIIKIITRFIKKIFKDSTKVKRIRNYVWKCNLYLYFLI